MSNARDLGDSAAIINFIDGLTSDVQQQLNTLDPLPSQTGQSGKYLTTDGTDASWGTVTTDPTLGTLTKTFAPNESASISLTSSVLAPVVSVTKEVPQTGVTNNNWDVNSTTENYTRLDSAAATTLDFVGFNISAASFTDSFSVAAQDTSPRGLAFNTDGTKMFFVGDTGDSVYEYTLSTGFDASTAVYSQNFSVSAQDTAPRDIAFNSDGTKMFVIGQQNDSVYEYTLSTGFDVSTASYVDAFSVSAQETTPNGIAFNTVGTKMFVVGQTGDAVNEYTLSTGFDVSTTTYSQNFSVAAQDTAPQSMTFNTDGTKMFVVGASTADAVYEYTLGTGFDVSTATYSQNFSVAAQNSQPRGLSFNSVGTKMFVTGDGSGATDVYEYNVGASLALGTGSFASADVGKTIEANSGEFILTATDGSFVEITEPTSYDQVASGNWSMYGVVYNSADGDLELSGVTDPATTFDVSTASYSQNFSVSAQETSPQGLAFSTDGTKMFIVGSSGDDVNEYTLSTGFDVSTASFVDSFSVAGQDTSPRGIAFNTDGTKMFIVGATGDDVNEYTLSTGFDVSTASFVDSFSVAGQETATNGIVFNTDGTKMFIVGSSGADVNEYSVGTLAAPTGYHPVHTTASIDTTYWTDINSMTADQNAGDGNVYYAISTDDRTTWTVIDNTDGERDIVRNNAGTWQYNSNGTYASETWVNGTTNAELATLAEAMEGASSITNAFDVSTAAYSQSFSVASQDGAPQGVAFNSTGTKMFIVGEDGNDVNEYTLSTGFNVSTASYSQNFSVSSQDTSPRDIAFNADGTKMFIAGRSGNAIYEYTLSTGYDVSTSSFVDSLNIFSQESEVEGLTFSTDGTKMFIVGGAGDEVNEYDLTTGFDLSTASFSQNFSVSAQETQPFGISFNTDGTKMLIVGATGRDVNEYDLTTGFDVSTASFVDSFSVSSQATNPNGIAFNTNGTKMFITCSDTDNVYEYNVGTASYTNQMDKTQLDAVTDPNHIALGNDLDLAIIFNMTSGSIAPSSDGVAINYDANVLNKGAVLGTDYDFDAPAQNSVRITALAGNNLKVRII